MTRFEYLLFDIHLTILNFLGPLDILRLRRTCKILQRTTSERIVWINALLRVCVRNTIFLPTFPIHDMSLSALEYAATGPERFLCSVAKSNLLEPRSHCADDNMQCEHDITKDITRDIFLVPGGRYLITKGWTRLAIWDLGIPGSYSTRSKLISSLFTYLEDFLLVHPTEDGRGLTILINHVLEDTGHIAIYRIYPSDSFPSLLKIAELSVSQKGVDQEIDPDLCSLSKNKVIYVAGSTLKLWDYVEDAWAWIQVPPDCERLTVSESAILLQCRDHVLIWEIPPLSKSKPLFSGPPPPNTSPAFCLKIPDGPLFQYRGSSMGPCDWYSGSSQPLPFDFQIGHELHRFEVVQNFNKPVITTVGKYLDTAVRAFSSCRFCNDTLVSWFPLDGRVESRIASIPSIAGHTIEPIDSTITILPKLLEYERGLYVPRSLCPFSGRFAYPNGREVIIVDYFLESLPMAHRNHEPGREVHNSQRHVEVVWGRRKRQREGYTTEVRAV